MNEKPIRGSQKQPDHIFISIADDAKTTMNVTWRTCTEIEKGYVLYREDGTDEILRTDACTEVFESDIDISNMYWAKLTGLKAGTKYFYTCGDDENRSEEFYFETEPENLQKFKFICVSDQQQGEPHDCPDYSYFNHILKETLKQHPDARFILTGGDNTDCGQHEVQWNGAFSGLKGVVEHIPFMMTLGNHDNRGFKDYKNGIGRYYSEPAEFFGKQFKGSYADNGPENWKTENYTFDYGNAHFMVIGVNGPEEVNEWMINDLKNCDKQWKIGSYHFPICYSGSDCQNYDAYPVMREGFEMLDLVFSGHEHNFSRSFPMKNEELFERPSQGTVHYMLGNSCKNPPGTRALAKVWHSAFYTQEEDVSVIAVVEIEGGKMTLTSTIFEDGRIVDKCTIDKDRDEITPYAVVPKYNRTRMMFKGAQLGLCQYETPCRELDGIWYAPLGVLVGYIGGSVVKEKGKITLEVYGRKAEFFEDSDIAVTDRGEVKLESAVKRLDRDQLYMPASACEVFDMRWAYAKRNNFISFEHESEDKPVTVQP
ncbi:MAG: metallophosphoesterase family protein [Clostridia bacterium]|nr:metallophosphoesterase family protein [Clostridia bacterium]